jgi:hypothetical protein
MESQNITLSIRKDLLRKARLLAVQRQTSLSGLLAEFLEQIINEESGYNEARNRQVSWLETGFDLGTAGSMPVNREELHAR